MKLALEPPALPPQEHVRMPGTGWRVSEVVCTLGPQDRPFEEQHQTVSIGAVLTGTFQYRSDAGDAMLYPGAFMLGNVGQCYECGHQHGIGDRCLAVRFDAEYFDEIAAGVTGSSRFRFRAGMLPALRRLAPPMLRIQAQLRAADSAAVEEAVVEMAEAVVESLSGKLLTVPNPAARDQRRLSAVLHYIEEHSQQTLDLDALAAIACMSKYHFLRTFRRTLGLTPHQYLIGQRLRQAATALQANHEPISAIAYAAGFPDLSGFNALFRETFGVSPRVFRNGA